MTAMNGEIAILSTITHTMNAPSTVMSRAPG
jgi:hypothetical protein